MSFEISQKRNTSLYYWIRKRQGAFLLEILGNTTLKWGWHLPLIWVIGTKIATYSNILYMVECIENTLYSSRHWEWQMTNINPWGFIYKVTSVHSHWLCLWKETDWIEIVRYDNTKKCSEEVVKDVVNYKPFGPVLGPIIQKTLVKISLKSP